MKSALRGAGWCSAMSLPSAIPTTNPTVGVGSPASVILLLMDLTLPPPMTEHGLGPKAAASVMAGEPSHVGKTVMGLG